MCLCCQGAKGATRMPLSSPVDFSALVSERSCTEPLLNRVQRMVDALFGFIMRACRDFCQLASGARTWITCCAVFYICAASFSSSKQTHRCAPPCGCAVLAVLVVMLHLLSTVDAGKLRPWRDATANVWAEGKPSERDGHAKSTLMFIFYFSTFQRTSSRTSARVHVYVYAHTHEH